MKKFLTTFSIVAALVALSSCNKEIEKTAPETTDSVRTVHFTAGPVTKTVFGEISGTTIPTLWTENHSVAISLNLNTFKQSSVPEVSEDGKKATFTAEFEASTGTFYAISPYAALPGQTLTGSKAITVEIAASQIPLEKSVDEKAQILVAKKEVTSESTSDVAFSFEHFTAYGKFGFSNLSLAEGEKVASVSLTAEENWAGRFYYYFENNTFAVNSAGKTISLTTDKTKDIWFACAPVDLGGTSLSVVITTDKGTTYSKIVEIPGDRKFESGHVSSFTIDMSGIKAAGAVEYELVTDASMLSVGSQVIIAASGSNFALGTTQNSNNRGQAAITKSGNKIVSPDKSVQILTVENGNTEGTFAFSTGSGYLFAAGDADSGNYLRTETNLTANSSWKITISSNSATIVSQGNAKGNTIRYNSSNNPPIFSCYASGQADVSIYMLPDDRESVSLTFSEDSYELEVESDEYKGFRPQTATIEPSSLASKVVYSISDASNVTSGFNTTNGSFTLTGNAGTATITASYAGDDSYKFAQASYTIKVKAANTGEITPIDKEYSFDFNTMANSGWAAQYAQHTAYDDDVVKIDFESANKNQQTITDIPVTKGSPVSVVLKDGTMNTVSFTCVQWTNKAQTITLHYSTDAGKNYNSTGIVSNNFSISSSSLPEGTNAVKITFSSTSNQIGIKSVSFNYTPSK